MKSQMLPVTCHRCVNPQSGFTLVEMIVSIGLFTIIMFMATSAFLSIVNTDRKARSVRIATDNLNIALEDMSRRIKTGSRYYCGALGAALGSVKDCVTGNILFINNQDGITRTKYELFGTSILRDGNLITSNEITINNLNFIVSGSGVGTADNEQPMVVIVIDGAIGSGQTASGFKIQTTVTQRAYDN